MAASTSTVALSSSIVAAPSSLSSRTSFAPQVLSAAPSRSTARRGVSMVVRARNASEEPKAARRELLAGLMAAAAFASAGNSIAASGPGTDGAKITAKQADDLLKAGDEFTNNDSPKRFGGERVGPQALRNADKVAQQAGSGAVEGLQNNDDAGSRAIETAKQNVEKTGERLGDLFKPNNSSSDLSTNAIEDAANNVKGGVQDLVNNGPGKIKSDVDTASSKVRSDIETTKGKVKNDVATTQGAANKADSGNVLNKAQEKAGNAVEGGKGFFGDLKNKITVSFYSPEHYTFRAHMESLLKDNVNMKFGKRPSS